ncbi:MAG: hypothetical protein ACLRWQ_23270 [Flavonifractor plautii]
MTAWPIRTAMAFTSGTRRSFVTDYASTDPSEDIAESFTYFVLWDAPEGDAVWEEKLNFFYRYPELVEFRTQARARLGL